LAVALINEIDNNLIGFVDWHRYADWRNAGENDAPKDETTYRALIASQALIISFARAPSGSRCVAAGILNICGETELPFPLHAGSAGAV